MPIELATADGGLIYGFRLAPAEPYAPDLARATATPLTGRSGSTSASPTCVCGAGWRIRRIARVAAPPPPALTETPYQPNRLLPWRTVS
jgi:hypothetical protein